MAYVAVDIGGTGSRGILAGTGEAVVETRCAGLVRDQGRARIEDAIDEILAALSGGDPVDTVAIGAAAVMTMSDPAVVAAHVRTRWAASQVIVASDIVTTHIAAFQGSAGVVLAAGTGVTALGSDLRTVWKRSDGWGHLLGDLGGGAWIGSRGMAAALAAHDRRRGGSLALLDALRAQWGAPESVPAALSASPSPAGALALFVPAVVAAADSGDAVAATILRRAGGHLADTALSVLGPGLPARVRLVGGIADVGPLLTVPFTRAVLDVHPGAEVRVGGDGSLSGAVWLAEAAQHGRYFDHPPFIVTNHQSKEY